MLLAYGSPQLLIMSDHFPTETNMEKVMSATGESSALCYSSLGHGHTYTAVPEGVVAPSPPESPRDSDQDSEVDHEPIQERYDNPSYSRFRRVASKTIVSFGPNDPENPVNWKKVR